MNKKGFNYIWTGILAFWAPLVLMIYAFKTIWPIITKLSKPISRLIPFHDVAGEIFDFIIGLLIIILITYIIGWIVQKSFLSIWTKKVDRFLSLLFPGYSFYKNFISNENEKEQQGWQSVLVKDEDEIKLGFIIEEKDQICTVYIPDTPNPYEGEIVFKKRVNLQTIDISFKQAVSIIRHYGKGISEIIQKSIEKNK